MKNIIHTNGTFDPLIAATLTSAYYQAKQLYAASGSAKTDEEIRIEVFQKWNDLTRDVNRLRLPHV